MKNKTNEINFEELSSQSGLSLYKMNVKKKSRAMRTTFRLTDHAIESLEELSKDTKLKDLFDSFGDFLTNIDKLFIDMVVESAEKMDKYELKKCEKKSFAISKKTVKIFNDLSKKNEIVRDAFVNQFIIFINNFIILLKKEDDKKIKLAQNKINEFWEKSEKFQKELFELLGDDHQVAKEFGYINVMFMNLDFAIDEYLESGKPIELF